MPEDLMNFGLIPHEFIGRLYRLGGAPAAP